MGTMFEYQVNEEVKLKIFEVRHAELLFNLTNENRKYLGEWLPFVETTTKVDQSKAFIQKSLEKFAKGNGFDLGIWLNNQLVGTIGFHYIDDFNKKTSIGYYLSEHAQKKGIMTACVKALLKYAFEELNLHRVEIRVATGNKKSQAIPERLGFTKEGVIRGVEKLNGEFVDHVVYGILKDEFKA